MTESASQVATTRPGIIEPAGCVGTPLAFAEVSVTGNRLGVSGPIVGGSIITQDLGRIDEQGRIWVEGRCDDVINSGGELISPAEVEAVLTAHPNVSDAAVVGLPDPTWGERTVAAVVSKNCDNESLRLWCETQLAAFKIPKQFHQIESIPRTELGKLSRATVREQLMNQMEIKK
jgi:O-succinylbenzoic acid--CoA ligase